MTFTLKRFFSSLIVLWGVCTVTFFLLHLTPGDPVELLLQDLGSQNEATFVRHDLGLDQPLIRQYILFFEKLAHGDLGTSYSTRTPVLEEIESHLPSTLALALAAMFFAIVIGIPLGVLSVFKQATWIDSLTGAYSTLGLSIPSFWLGPLLILFFSIKLDWLPVDEQTGISSVVLPALSLGVGLSSVVLRMTRASLLEVMKEDYIQVARSKGLPEKTVLFKHALKNAMTPILTILSLQFGAVLTGVVITETIFDWPGLGILLYSGLKSRNYPLVQGCVLCIAVIYILVNFLTDLLYPFINPKLQETPS